jgi:uncharacterized protein YidB (DUF937 family)
MSETPDMQRWLRLPKQLWGQLASEEFARAVEDLIQRHGTVTGVVKRMEEMGLGSVARSWVGNSVNEPIFSEQLHALFGTSVLRALAAKLDLQPRDLVRRLSQVLPREVNRLAESGNHISRNFMWSGWR